MLGNQLDASGSTKQNRPLERINQGHKSWVSTGSISTRRETSWIHFQSRHYHPPAKKQQSCLCLGSSNWCSGKEPEEPPLVLPRKAQGSNKILC